MKITILIPLAIGGPGSLLNEKPLEISPLLKQVLISLLNEGFDYGKLEAARKLQEGQEYVLNTELGYISR